MIAPIGVPEGQALALASLVVLLTGLVGGIVALVVTLGRR